MAGAGPAPFQKHWLVYIIHFRPKTLVKVWNQLTLGFFILLNQQERRSAEEKVAGPALNSGPLNGRGTLEGDKTLVS